MAPQVLHFAVCLCDGVTLSDFIPPTEILASLNWADRPDFQFPAEVQYRFKYDFLAPTAELVKSAGAPAAPSIQPTKTYDDALQEGKQYDVLWVPAGPWPFEGESGRPTPPSEIAFIKAQAPGAKYVMSVCGGSAILAQAGVLSGKRATTNKSFFKVIKALTPKDVDWVAKARWVVDGNIWSSSGISAGSDMALAFMEHLVGREVTTFVRGVHEIREVKEEDDPFAVFHGLV